MSISHTVNQSGVISVNPAEKTLGQLNPDVASRFIRRRMILHGAEAGKRHRTLDLVFGMERVGAESRSVGLLFFRMLFGAVLVFGGLVAGGGEQLMSLTSGVADLSGLASEAVLELVAGVALCLGLLTREVMAAAAVWFAVRFGMDAAAGIYSQTWALYAIGAASFAFTGAGRQSADAILRNAIFTARRRRARRLVEKRLSYEAFKYAGR